MKSVYLYNAEFHYEIGYVNRFSYAAEIITYIVCPNLMRKSRICQSWHLVTKRIDQQHLWASESWVKHNPTREQILTVDPSLFFLLRAWVFFAGACQRNNASFTSVSSFKLFGLLKNWIEKKVWLTQKLSNTILVGYSYDLIVESQLRKISWAMANSLSCILLFYNFTMIMHKMMDLAFGAQAIVPTNQICCTGLMPLKVFICKTVPDIEGMALCKFSINRNPIRGR